MVACFSVKKEFLLRRYWVIVLALYSDFKRSVDGARDFVAICIWGVLLNNKKLTWGTDSFRLIIEADEVRIERLKRVGEKTCRAVLCSTTFLWTAGHF